MAGLVRGWLLTLAGLIIGGATAYVGLAFLAMAGLALAALRFWPRGQALVRARVHRGARRLAEGERRRLIRFLDADISGEYSGERAVRYLVARGPVGILGHGVVFLLGLGVTVAVTMLLAWASGFPWALIEDAGGVTLATILGASVPGVLLLYLNLTGIAGVAGLERRLAAHYLGPSTTELLRRRITELSISRAGIVEAVDQERRRIERDLHDGVQQRLVALGMLLGRARRQGDSELLAQAHEESQEALRDLREVAWRVYPAGLDAVGLRDALAAVAERSAVPVSIDYALPGELPPAVETAVYFVVCEAVTNAAKHSGAGRIAVRLAATGPLVEVRVHDDGAGGADPYGGGLSGLARRVAALDGRFAVHSPLGGPTLITAELPCA
ncbi:histidine kinase [Spongiactinospora sp. TRM90649]|uniref:sensor histidine kinase n=1 Tax=Spongiactinospora sp. TRM90649 TaxID=3031114 RepID=UPI0023F76929|nr:histidine kinase [Spongiactinospora sp. TRM90649]MDF5757986.1 histidine kinase [Spongiactinospora sp. TRM90649]